MKRIAFLGKTKESSIAAWDWLYRRAGPDLEPVHAGRHEDAPECDMIVSFLYDRRVPRAVRARAVDGAVNFHPAPLPRYRGLWGCSRAILDGAAEFGVTAHVMSDEFDEGPIVASRPVAPLPADTAATLDYRAQQALLALFKDFIERYLAHGMRFELTHQSRSVPQPPTRAELEAMKTVLHTDDAAAVDRKARAFWYPPYPGAGVVVNGGWYTIAPRCVAAGRSA